MASTSIKVAGGVSAKDAAALSREMGCDPEYLQHMRKRENYTEFACYIRNVTPRPVRLPIPFGQMEAWPRMSDAELAFLLAQNRRRYGATGGEEWGEEWQETAQRGPGAPPDEEELL